MDFGRDKNEEKEAGQDTGRKHGGQGKDRGAGFSLGWTVLELDSKQD